MDRFDQLDFIKKKKKKFQKTTTTTTPKTATKH
jgi:hypothetical protein